LIRIKRRDGAPRLVGAGLDSDHMTNPEFVSGLSRGPALPGPPADRAPAAARGAQTRTEPMMTRSTTPLSRATAFVVVAGICVAALGAWSVGRDAQASEDEPRRLVTIVASGEPETQLMAMVLTMQSVRQGAEARILLCGPGARMAWKDAPESATAPQKPRGMSPQGLMAKLAGMGVRTEVCAIHLPNADKTEADLIEGVGVARPPDMAAGIMAEDVRVLSF